MQKTPLSFQYTPSVGPDAGASSLHLRLALLATLSGWSVTGSADPVPLATPFERCYGVVQKGMNDCGTRSHRCAGKSVQDGDPEDFVYIPAGTCQKLVGGSAAPAADPPSTADPIPAASATVPARAGDLATPGGGL